MNIFWLKQNTSVVSHLSSNNNLHFGRMNMYYPPVFLPLGRVPNLKNNAAVSQQMYRICAWKCINLSAISSTSLKLESISGVLWKELMGFYPLSSIHPVFEELCYWGHAVSIQISWKTYSNNNLHNDSLWNEAGNVNKLYENAEYLNSYSSILWRELVCKTNIRHIIREKCYRIITVTHSFIGLSHPSWECQY